VVSAVGTAHARGIVHRDLKPSNIFLSAGHAERPLVKVLDFGNAKWIATQHERPQLRTQTGSTLGTPSYMSPEQATAERGVDHRADIWSLGVILYECLSGARPVDGENAAQMVMRLLSSGIIPIEQLVPELPARLSETIGHMLARDPASRPQDLSGLFEVLEALAGESAPRFGPPRTHAVQAVDDSPLQPASLPVPAHGLLREGEVTGPPSTLTPSGSPPSAAQPSSATARGRAPLRALALLGVAFAAGLILARARYAPLAMTAPAASVHPDDPQRLSSPPRAFTELAPAAAAAPALVVNETEAQPVARPTATLLARPRPSKPPGSTAPSVRKASVKSGARNAGAPRGAECERSRDCASRLCLAMLCE